MYTSRFYNVNNVTHLKYTLFMNCQLVLAVARASCCLTIDISFLVVVQI